MEVSGLQLKERFCHIRDGGGSPDLWADEGRRKEKRADKLQSEGGFVRFLFGGVPHLL